MRNALGWAAAAALLPIVWFAGAERTLAHSDCARTISAEVVVLDQPLMFNRLGAQNVNGIVYALARDVVDPNGVPITMGGRAEPGRVRLRPDKRPRPLVLRVAAGDCLEVHFQNLLAPQANPNQAPLDALGGIPFRLQIDDQVASRFAGFHPQGMQLVDSIADDGSFVGRNGNSLVPPGGAISYRFFAEHEGTFLLDTPRVLHCFRFEAAENPALRRRGNPAEVEWLAESGRIVAPGETVSIRFRLRDGDRHEPLVGLPDVRIRAWAAPGDHRTEVAAREIEPGLYEARLAFAAPGAWYLHVGSARAKVRFGELPYLGLQVSALAARKE